MDNITQGVLSVAIVVLRFKEAESMGHGRARNGLHEECVGAADDANDVLLDRAWREQLPMRNELLSTTLYYKGLALARLRRWEEAVGAVDMALGYKPTNWGALRKKGELLLKNFARQRDENTGLTGAERGLECLRTIIDHKRNGAPNEPSPGIFLKCCCLEAEFRFKIQRQRRGNMAELQRLVDEELFPLLQRAQDVEPNEPWPTELRIRLFRLTKRFREAEREFQAVDVDPTSKMYEEYAEALYFFHGKWGRRIQDTINAYEAIKDPKPKQLKRVEELRRRL
jgi:tetratricopeptide (TPR) repeat protein